MTLSSALLVVTSTDGADGHMPQAQVLHLRPLDVADTVAIAAVYAGDDAAAMCASDIAPAARGEPALVHHEAAEWATRQQKAGKLFLCLTA